MLDVRNLHTFVPNEFGHPTLFAVDAAGAIDTAAATHWGVYQGDPATKVSGNMDVWEPTYDPEEGPDPYTESWIRTSGFHLIYDAGDGDWYEDKTVQLGFIYSGAELGDLVVTPSTEGSSDGYYSFSATYSTGGGPAPQIVWVVGATYTPPEEPPTSFWTNLINCREVDE